MITNNRKPSWFFYPAWVVLSSISIPIAFAIYWALASLANQVVGSTILVRGQSHITEDFLLPYILALVLGLAFGLLQYIVLHRHLPQIGWWVAATTVGWVLGFIGNSLLLPTLFGTLDVRVIRFALMYAFAGGVMGLAQWWILHQRVRYAALWILANILSWGVVGWGSVALSNTMVIPAVGILIIPGITTSIVLWLLLDWFPRRELQERV
jgi:hypothetical protein